MLEGLSPIHLILVLAIVLIVVGPGRLPQTGAALGKALRGFREAVEGKEPAERLDDHPEAPVEDESSPTGDGGDPTS